MRVLTICGSTFCSALLCASAARADDNPPPAQVVHSKKATKKAKAAGSAPPAAPLDPPLLHPNDEAPLFRAPLHNSAEAGAGEFDLATLVGDDATDDKSKLVLVSFFATWCGPCKRELPLLVQLASSYGDRGLRVVSVAIDRNEADWPQIASLVKANRITFPVVKDRYNFIARRWLGEKSPLPSLFLVGRDGQIKLVKQGYTTGAESFLRGEIDRALQAAK